MELKSLTCPSCGATLQIPEGKECFFCTFCGSQIQVDDGRIRVDITNRVVDVARLKELELSEKRRVREEQAQKNELANNRRSLKSWLIACIIWIVLGAIPGTFLEKSDICMIMFICLLTFIPPFLAITVPKSAFKDGTQLSAGAKVGICFLIMIGGCVCMGIMMAIFNALISILR